MQNNTTHHCFRASGAKPFHKSDPLRPLLMNSNLSEKHQAEWNQWCSDLSEAVLSDRHRLDEPTSSIRKLIEDQKRLPRPLPTEVTWSFQWNKDHSSHNLAGSLLELLVCLPEHVYHENDYSPATSLQKLMRHLAQEWQEEGLASNITLIQKAIHYGLTSHSLDAHTRLDMALSWTTMSDIDELSRCKLICEVIEEMSWHTQSGMQCLDDLVQKASVRTNLSELPITKESHLFLSALKSGNIKVIHKVLDLGFQIPFDWSDPDSGFNLWHYAARSFSVKKEEFHDEIVSILTNHVPPDFIDQKTRSAGHFGEGFVSTKRVLRSPKWPEWSFSAGQTPLAIAIQNLKMTMVNHFLDQGAKTSQTDEQGNTPLHLLGISYADGRNIPNAYDHDKSYDSVISLIKNYIDHGGSVNVKNNQGFIPLQLMIKSRALEVIAYLLDQNPEEALSPLEMNELLDTLSQRDDQYKSLVEHYLLKQEVKNISLSISPKSEDFVAEQRKTRAL